MDKIVKVRNGNIEAFRCVLMFFIVFYHCFIHGVFCEVRAAWSLVFCLLVWHVDAFVAISGYFGIKWSFRKFLQLYFIILFYSVLNYVVLLVFSPIPAKDLSFDVWGGWFGGTYLMLMMISPLLNCCLEKLCEKPVREVFISWSLFALAMSLTWAPERLFTGVYAYGTGPYSIAMLVFIYLTTRLARLFELRISIKQVGLGISLSVGVILAIFAFFGGGIAWKYSSYDAPFIWVIALLATFFFAEYVCLPDMVCRIARFLGPSMFGIYLCHDATIFGRRLYVNIEEWIIAHQQVHPLLIIFVSSILTFAISLVIDLFRRMLFFGVELTYERFRRSRFNIPQP